MARIRAFENAAEEASRGSVAAFGATADTARWCADRCIYRSARRQSPPASCANLARDDILTSTHRGHGHTLAKGADTERMMCELFGRAAALQAARAARCISPISRVGMLGANGVVAAGIADRRRRRARSAEDPRQHAPSWPASSATARSTAARSSKGSTGPKIFELPVLFVCEDNGYSPPPPATAA